MTKLLAAAVAAFVPVASVSIAPAAQARTPAECQSLLGVPESPVPPPPAHISSAWECLRTTRYRESYPPIRGTSKPASPPRRWVGMFMACAKKLPIGGVAALAATALLAPPAYADPCNNQACLEKPFSEAGGPYLGEWVAHKERVVISPDGSGTEVSDYGTVTFKMGSVSTGQPITAEGDITGGGRAPVGSWVSMQLVDGGRGMLFGMANGDQQFPFCKIVDGNRLNSDDCGA